ncbi:ORF2 [Fusarium oxysporum mymonavirus 1]|uniref:ORF2 n=1 Tax=Fusarium oxysporum mymonavirus 1 TaxID=2928187 RepID=A0AAX3A7T5_9MONO|nr:ORF2 [Fusarium oxysporum mymonavirus 1]UNQ74998.1 ORF2 [Fusarium oxysporum mymonavirus 1]
MAPSTQQFFSPQNQTPGGRQKRLLKSAISSAIPIPVLPQSVSVDDRVKYLATMAALGTSISADIAQWKVYILAYTLMLFPQFERSIQRDIYAPVVMTAETIAAVIHAYDDLSAMPETYDADDLHEAEIAFNETVVGPGLPLPNPAAKTRYLPEETTAKILASHYSILLFIAGKRIDTEDHTPLTKNRPDALIRKAHLAAEPQLLTGCLRFSDKSHSELNSAWQELAALRALIFPAFAEFSSEATDDIQDLIYTTMHLLRFSGMQHAKIVHGFLGAYPWARDVPALRSAIAKFDESIIAAAGYPTAIQPYVKLIYGDKSEIFPRKEMEVLISCAVAATQDTSPDIVNFYNSDAFNPIVEAFMAERDRRGEVRTLTLKAQEANLRAQVSLGHKAETPSEDYESDGLEEEAEELS